ncbi:MAG: hypothetical protein JXB49_00995 [Bacteroidales bacterium]|nr:hypothetical protein [Bacteroidales bacterium]
MQNLVRNIQVDVYDNQNQIVSKNTNNSGEVVTDPIDFNKEYKVQINQNLAEKRYQSYSGNILHTKEAPVQTLSITKNSTILSGKVNCSDDYTSVFDAQIFVLSESDELIELDFSDPAEIRTDDAGHFSIKLKVENINTDQIKVKIQVTHTDFKDYTSPVFRINCYETRDVGNIGLFRRESIIE